MGDNTGIGWTDASWNCVVGCSIKSPGCINCYAQKSAYRQTKMNPNSHYNGTVELRKGSPVWTGMLKAAPEHIWTQPLRWARPRRIFVNSMSDMFHENMQVTLIYRAFAIMAMARHHQYQILTKRSDVMRRVIGDPGARDSVIQLMHAMGAQFAAIPWPLPNVWLGVSAERQKEWDERKEDLRQTPAAVRFVSFEPLIGRIDEPNLDRYVDWAIIGGESGDGARPINYSWVEALVLAGMASKIAVFVKQMGARPIDDLDETKPAFDARLKHRKGEDSEEWPAHFRVQEYPRELNQGSLV